MVPVDVSETQLVASAWILVSIPTFTWLRLITASDDTDTAALESGMLAPNAYVVVGRSNVNVTCGVMVIVASRVGPCVAYALQLPIPTTTAMATSATFHFVVFIFQCPSLGRIRVITLSRSTPLHADLQRL